MRGRGGRGMLILGRHYLREWGINKLLKMGVAGASEEGREDAHMLRAGARLSAKSALIGWARHKPGKLWLPVGN